MVSWGNFFGLLRFAVITTSIWGLTLNASGRGSPANPENNPQNQAQAAVIVEDVPEGAAAAAAAAMPENQNDLADVPVAEPQAFLDAFSPFGDQPNMPPNSLWYIVPVLTDENGQRHCLVPRSPTAISNTDIIGPLDDPQNQLIMINALLGHHHGEEYENHVPGIIHLLLPILSYQGGPVEHDANGYIPAGPARDMLFLIQNSLLLRSATPPALEVAPNTLITYVPLKRHLPRAVHDLLNETMVSVTPEKLVETVSKCLATLPANINMNDPQEFLGTLLTSFTLPMSSHEEAAGRLCPHLPPLFSNQLCALLLTCYPRHLQDQIQNMPWNERGPHVQQLLQDLPAAMWGRIHALDTLIPDVEVARPLAQVFRQTLEAFPVIARAFSLEDVFAARENTDNEATSGASAAAAAASAQNAVTDAQVVALDPTQCTFLDMKHGLHAIAKNPAPLPGIRMLRMGTAIHTALRSNGGAMCLPLSQALDMGVLPPLYLTFFVDLRDQILYQEVRRNDNGRFLASFPYATKQPSDVNVVFEHSTPGSFVFLASDTGGDVCASLYLRQELTGRSMLQDIGRTRTLRPVAIPQLLNLFRHWRGLFSQNPGITECRAVLDRTEGMCCMLPPVYLEEEGQQHVFLQGRWQLAEAIWEDRPLPAFQQNLVSCRLVTPHFQEQLRDLERNLLESVEGAGRGQRVANMLESVAHTALPLQEMFEIFQILHGGHHLGDAYPPFRAFMNLFINSVYTRTKPARQ